MYKKKSYLFRRIKICVNVSRLLYADILSTGTNDVRFKIKLSILYVSTGIEFIKISLHFVVSRFGKILKDTL